MTQSITDNGLWPVWKIPGHVHSKISAAAIGAQLFVYVVLASIGNSYLVIWCLVLSLDAGFVCAMMALGLARTWRAGLLAFALLCVNALSFIILLFTALQNKFMIDIH